MLPPSRIRICVLAVIIDDEAQARAYLCDGTGVWSG
jgi:hypothetical protein